MKNTIIGFLLFLGFAIFCGCDENAPVIPCLKCETDQVIIEPTDKKILIEEFTGVGCVNCPAGSAEVENLLDIHGEQLIAVSIHAGFFSTPYPDSKEDYTIPEGESLLEFLDQPTGFPTAVINRKRFQNQDDLQLVQASWAGLIQEETAQRSPLVLDLDLNFDEPTRVLTATTKIQSAEDLPGDYRYSVMVLETGIVDLQLTPPPGDIQEDYVHKHVLRDMMTPFDGETIEEEFIAGIALEKEHQMTLPDEWNFTKVSVVVLVHKTGESREIVQVEEKKLAD